MLTGMMRCPDCGATLVAHRIHDTLKDGTKVVRRYYICSNFRAKGSRVCTSNSVKADMAEQYVTDRIAAVVRKPKILEDIVARINNNRTVNVVPLQKELASVDKELGTLDAQKKKYFKLYEADVVDNEFLIQRMNELKQQHEALTRRRQEALRQLERSSADPVPLHQVKQELSQFHELLSSTPIETQKNLLQIIVKQIHVKKGQKIEGIELEFDDKVNACFLGYAPSTQTVAGAFAFPKQKFNALYTIVI